MAALEAPEGSADEERAWKLLLLHNRLLLWAPLANRAAGRARARAQQDRVLDRLERAERGNWTGLLADARRQATAAAERRAGRPAPEVLEGPTLAGEVV